MAETLFWEQHYAPTSPADVALEPACAWREPNVGTVPLHCPQPRSFVVGLGRDLSALGPTSGNSPCWQVSWTSRALLTDDTLPPNRSAASYQQLNPLNTGGPCRAAYWPQSSRGYREDTNQAGSCYRCGQRGHYRNECPIPHSTRRVSNQGNDHSQLW
ncbi:hypothetical protein MRX96_000465 [Rhipicephalus microplus]|uniref:CCHC-type domain-containing protein n=1 Tax=Rhipicephalus microplus TaxID=6941 RepID=A0A9J6EH11_RHIMP|nr:hypothetical protein HPB51_009415 [Rhipicephalus microplus]